MKTLIALLLAGTAFAQTQIPWRASVTSTVTASSSYTFTVQQNGYNSQNVQAAVISCGTNTFTVAQAQNGAAATATALTQTITGTVAASANALIALGPQGLQTPLTVTAWTASNVGTGTALSGVTPFSSIAIIGPFAGRSYIASFASYTSGGSQVPNNYSLTVTNTGSGSCSLVIDIYGVQAQ